jgi:hypothetical protein
MKFTIRDLLLVTVIAALAASWWVERTRRIAEIERDMSLERTIHQLESQLTAAELDMRVREIDAQQASKKAEMLQLQMDLSRLRDNPKK